MKNLVFGLLVSFGLVSAVGAQDCRPVYCCAAPTTTYVCCCLGMIQETVQTQEPVSVVQQAPTDQNAAPSSVLATPAPEAALIVEPTAGVQTAASVSVNNSRAFGGSNLFRRRGGFAGRLFSRMR